MTYTKNALQLLKSEQDSMTSEWKQRIHIKSFEHLQGAGEYGENLFLLLLDFLEETDDHKVDEQIKTLAQMTAAAKIKSNENIAELIRNVSSARTIVFNRLTALDPQESEGHDFLLKINNCFDQFIFHTVEYYSNLKTKMFENQFYYISSTHKERLTLLGQITSSFVHEFRNPLTSIMGFIQLLKSENPEMKYLDIISKELSQLNGRITQFLDFSKKDSDSTDQQRFSLTELAEEVIEFLYPSILGVNADVIKQLDEAVFLQGIREEIRQVLLNIILNALEVMSDIPDPVIEISIHRTGTHSTRLIISNNGPKIDDAILPGLFKPFVTTKERGTGLGLFVCKEIIEKHHGSLQCRSTESLTSFIIEIPCVP